LRGEEAPRRVFSVSPVRVEVRLYRRSRTAAFVSQKVSHFEYYLRCSWTGSPMSEKECCVLENWWDDLPPNYEIRRRWSDIMRFHKALVALEQQAWFKRMRVRVPDLPSKGDLNEFLQNVAATGDACALSKGRLNEEDASHDELSILRQIEEKHLATYFAEASFILGLVPLDVLRSSNAFRQFATSGPSSLQRRPNQFVDTDQAALEAASLALRESWHTAAREKKASGEEAAKLKKAPATIAGELSPISAPTPMSLALKMPEHGGSHYNFFAQVAPAEAFGSASDRDVIRRMVAKERRDMGNRSMLDPEPRSMCSTSRSRSSPLLTAGKAVSDQSPCAGASNKPSQNLRVEIMMADICAGLRTLLLGEEPPEGSRGRRRMQPVEIKGGDTAEGSQEAVLIVYRTYRRLLDEDLEKSDHLKTSAEALDLADGESDDESMLPEQEQRQRRHERERLTYVRDLGVSPELMPVTWHTFFTLINNKSDFSEDCRVKSTCAALLRACRDWRQLEASVAQTYLGVSLNMLFQWLWPSAAYDNVARMLSWIGRLEFEKILQPTPPMISREARLQLENIFKMLDTKRRGTITAEDFAGTSNSSVASAPGKSIIDVDTVRAVYGHNPIGFAQFLEIMCEDNYRAHEDATHMQCGDGTRLEYVVHEVMGCRGWCLRDAPKSEESQRALVSAIGAEVSRWRKLGKTSKKRSDSVVQRIAVVDAQVEPTEHLPARGLASIIGKANKLNLGVQAISAFHGYK